jgi:general secretion pathway protein K
LTRARQRASDRGFALLLVLWSLVLVTLIITSLTAGARSDARIAINLRAAATAEAAADGAVYEALFHVLDTGQAHWNADGAPHRLAWSGGTILIRIEDESGKVNPNDASPELLRALLRALGVDDAEATRIAAAIVDWRSPDPGSLLGGTKLAQYRAAGLPYAPPDAPFRSLDELGAVRGVTPDILARLAPVLSLANDGDPDATRAPPPVARALRDIAGNAADAGAQGMHDAAGAVTIIAALSGSDGTHVDRRAVIRLTGGEARPYGVIGWN